MLQDPELIESKKSETFPFQTTSRVDLLHGEQGRAGPQLPGGPLRLEPKDESYSMYKAMLEVILAWARCLESRWRTD